MLINPSPIEPNTHSKFYQSNHTWFWLHRQSTVDGYNTFDRQLLDQVDILLDDINTVLQDS